MNRQRIRADLALLGLAAGWGGTFVMVKEATSAVAVFTFLTLRFSVAAIVLVAAARSALWSINRRAAAISVIAGLCFAAGYGFQTIGLQTIGPGRTGFVAGLTVVIVPIGAAILWRRRPNISAFIGIAFAVLGLALLTGGLSGEPPTAGDVWVLLGALWFAGQVLAISTLPRRSNPRALAAVQVVTMAIACAVIAALTEQPIWPTGWRVWSAVLFTGLIVTALGVTVQTWAQAYTSPTHAALIFTTEPVFAALTGFLAIGERLSVEQLIGGALILSGMIVSELGLPLSRHSREGGNPAVSTGFPPSRRVA